MSVVQHDVPHPRDGTTLDTDICIIGAGPAGLALASALAGSTREVVLLESGGTVADSAADALNDGAVIGDPYAGLRATRQRGVGGTTALWNTRTPAGIGAKFTPLDPVDFDAREAVALSGWPVSYAMLLPWYARAQQVCGLGAFAYDAAAWRGPARQPLDDVHPELESRVYQFGSRDALLTRMLRAAREAGNVRLISDATVVRLESGEHGRRAVRARVASRSGTGWWVSAREFVVCAGAIENARLLLVSGSEGGGLGNGAGWVGRCFMEHPRDRTLMLSRLSGSQYRSLRFYDLHQSSGSTAVGGRLAIAPEVIRAEGLLNASATLLPMVRPQVRRTREALRRLGRSGPLARWLPRGGTGWSSHPLPQAAFEGFTVLLNLEQAPDPENRIELARDRDAFGTPRAELHWRWRPRDARSQRRVREIVGATLERAGFSVVRRETGAVDPNAHHHAGTTRMHRDPAFGVVDASCRMHELDNVHIAGASVFPTAGFANPVLTIVALALRLAAHLMERR
jgi:choline dehydrogenase-like flavoprotein